MACARRHLERLRQSAAPGAWSRVDPSLAAEYLRVRAGGAPAPAGGPQISTRWRRIRPGSSCTPGATASFGFRRRFTVESSTGGVLYSYAYWTSQHHDFFRWLATKAEDPDWRGRRADDSGPRASPPTALRAEPSRILAAAARRQVRRRSDRATARNSKRPVNVHDSYTLQPLRLRSPAPSHIRRICRLRPCVRIMRNRFLIDPADLAGLGQLAHDFHPAGHHFTATAR